MRELTLAVDVETTGLRRDHLPDDDPGQPHVVELAARLFDEERRTVGGLSAVIKPNGWGVEPGAAAIHGITDEIAYQIGIPLDAALRTFMAFVIQAKTIVAHNVQFDRLMVQSELDRMGAVGKWWSSRSKDMHCTMEESTDRVGLPKPSGKPGFKFPTLEEAHAHFLKDQSVWKSDHRAWGDASACARIWFRLHPVPPAGGHRWLTIA